MTMKPKLVVKVITSVQVQKTVNVKKTLPADMRSVIFAFQLLRC
jgi:hypothetical protein